MSLITPAQLSVLLADAKPNLFGSVYLKKPLKLRKGMQAEAREKFNGVLYKSYFIKGFMSVSDYEKSVNNARERKGLAPDFSKMEHKWAKKFKGSDMVYIHQNEAKQDKFYLFCRLTKNSKSECIYIDSMGQEYSYEEVEPFLLAADKKKNKKRSREATAEKQGLEVEESVMMIMPAFDTIEKLAYGGVEYTVIPEAEGASAALIRDEATIEEEFNEQFNEFAT
jgi:hypothetical protein